jgi:FixJ family two-component response regulator
MSPLIAIVDDDEEYRQALAMLMKSLGFSAVAFSSAREFLASPRLAGTSCLIADINMPGMTGVELHRHLMKEGYCIPTILITGYPDDAARSRATAEGVLAYLTKPCSDSALLALVRSAVEPARSHRV